MYVKNIELTYFGFFFGFNKFTERVVPNYSSILVDLLVLNFVALYRTRTLSRTRTLT